MFMSGDIKIHKADIATRSCAAVVVLYDGSLAVWDTLPNVPSNEIEWRPTKDILVNTHNFDPGAPIKDMIIEPDIIVRPDQYERIERDGHSWKRHSAQSVKERAKERDDVDEDELPDDL